MLDSQSSPGSRWKREGSRTASPFPRHLRSHDSQGKEVYAMIVLAIIATVGALIWSFVVLYANSMRSSPGDFYGAGTIWAAWIIVLVLWLAWGVDKASARDLDGRYANSPLKQWFDTLKSGKGPCCSDADGSALSDTDWDTKDGRYRVRIEGKWWDVPDDAVITEPNRAGRTMVWPIYYRNMGTLYRIDIRCFMPGSMT